MKKQYTLLSLLLLPFSSIAQPVMTKAENYTIGTTIQRVICDPEAAGPSGANQTWNFTNLSPTGDTLTQWVEAPPSTNNPFPGADFVMCSSDSTFSYFDTSLAEINMMGLVDSSSFNQGILSYSNHLLTITRPITYGDTAVDSFYNTGNFGGFPFIGAGAIMLEADAYGTLQLPVDTFANVLRVRTLTHEYDSIVGFGHVEVFIASYAWYVDTSASPVFRVDSIKFTGLANDSTVDVQYLYKSAPTNVKETKLAQKIDASAALINNELIVSANFEAGKKYELGLYGINGQKVFNSSFTGTGQQQRLNINSDMSSGTYILTLRKQGNAASMTVIKVVKQ